MNYLAVLCVVGLINETAPFYGQRPQYVVGQSDVVYKACWTPIAIPDSATHTNITAAELPALAAQLPTLGKSVAISGITDPEAFTAAFGLVRCDKDGNVFTGGEL